jgi:hypothetical protein
MVLCRTLDLSCRISIGRLRGVQIQSIVATVSKFRRPILSGLCGPVATAMHASTRGCAVGHRGTGSTVQWVRLVGRIGARPRSIGVELLDLGNRLMSLLK